MQVEDDGQLLAGI